MASPSALISPRNSLRNTSMSERRSTRRMRLWQNRLTTSPQGFPISYSVNGRQFIAMPVGVGAASWGTTIPLMLTPDVKRPNTGNALFVFALP
jgi:hypothetical protein